MTTLIRAGLEDNSPEIPAKEPFNILLLDPSKSRLAGLLPVQSMDIYDNTGDYHPQGLYSNLIFGSPGERSRSTRHSFIDMQVTVLHPKIFQEVTRLKALYKGIMAGTSYAVWDDTLNDFVKSDIIDGSTGYDFFISRYKDIDHKRNASPARDLRINLIEKYRDKALYRYLVVLPAGLREISKDTTGRDVEDDINALYRKVIRASNSVPKVIAGNASVTDMVRWSLQKAFNEIYQYIEDILGGKKGFLLGKWASRNVQGGVRNVITGMDSSPKRLGDIDSISVDDTSVGLHQYMKSTVSKTINLIRNGEYGDAIAALPNKIKLIDKQTLHSVTITPNVKTSERWGTDAGLESLISGYVQLPPRHRPVVIEGHYLGLIYKHNGTFKQLSDIDELPDNLDVNDVTPLTWTEFFYIAVAQYSKEVGSYQTRYPIITDGSITPSKIYLNTTVPPVRMVNLDSDWLPTKDVYPNFPVVGNPFMDSMSVHPTKEGAYNADHDGDVLSSFVVESEEAKTEVNNYLNSKAAYMSPDGGLRYGFSGKAEIPQMVLLNFTRGLK